MLQCAIVRPLESFHANNYHYDYCYYCYYHHHHHHPLLLHYYYYIAAITVITVLKSQW